MNKMLLVGRLVKDPERGKGEHPKARFRIAVDRAYKREGEPQSDFFDVIVFGKTAECVLNYLSKGRLVAIDGRAQWRSWETAEKEKKKYLRSSRMRFHFLTRSRRIPQPGLRDGKICLPSSLHPFRRTPPKAWKSPISVSASTFRILT